MSYAETAENQVKAKITYEDDNGKKVTEDGVCYGPKGLVVGIKLPSGPVKGRLWWHCEEGFLVADLEVEGKLESGKMYYTDIPCVCSRCTERR